MRIHELVLENDQLDELTARGVGRGIGKVAGHTVRGTSDFFSGIKQGYKQARSGTAPASSGTPSSAAQSGVGTTSSGTAPASSGTPSSAAQSSAPPAMKAVEIVKDLDGVWQKATADQGSETTSPQVQNQIRTMAKQAGLTGQTIKENKVGYSSKFLGITI
jgi:hypothetical protein